MRLRDWGRRTTPEEFPLQYRAQFHAESVFDCKDPQTGYHGLTFVRRRGPYNFDFLSPRNNYITVTFVTDRPNSGVIDYVRIKTRWRSCLVDVRPVTMTATKRPGTRYRFDSNTVEIPVCYYKIMDFYESESKDDADAIRHWNTPPFDSLKSWKRLAQISQSA
jgi:hypothetical protein